MSSPFTCAESSPMYMPVGTNDDNDNVALDIPRRLMKVKIFYTFDNSHKTACLARLPHALHIPTLRVDDEIQVGLIALRRCIDAVLAASPELVAKPGDDYTVYSYDYSEHETPLVGQGMLSWNLASESATTPVPASSSQTMVTGRVRENILGLLNGGIKEALEVKLKLVPLPGFSQSEYLDVMARYRNLSSTLPDRYTDVQSVELNLDLESTFFAHQAIPGSSPIPAAMQQHNSSSIAAVGPLFTQQPSEEACASQSHTSVLAPARQGSNASSRAGSRPCSPASGRASGGPSRQFIPNHSSPGSTAPHANSTSISHSKTASDYDVKRKSNVVIKHEHMRPVKRACLVQAERDDKPPWGNKHEPLRITASTAASFRKHSRNPARAGNRGSSHAVEPIPRAPTPIPNQLSQQCVRAPVPKPRSLHGESTSPACKRYKSPYQPAGPCSEPSNLHRTEQMTGSEASPVDFTSSPPASPRKNDWYAASSPVISAIDSGYGSVSCSDPVESAAEPRSEPHIVISSKEWHMETPGPPEFLPKSLGPMPLNPQSQRAAVSAKSMSISKTNRRGRRPKTSRSTPTTAQSLSPMGGVRQPSGTPCPSSPHVRAQAESATEAQLQVAAQDWPQDQTHFEDHVQPRPISTEPQLHNVFPHQPSPSLHDPPSQMYAPTSLADCASLGDVLIKSMSKDPEPLTSAEKCFGEDIGLDPAVPMATSSAPHDNIWPEDGLAENHTDQSIMRDSESPQPLSATNSKPAQRKKQAIVAKCSESQARGEAPESCYICGVFFTPTWRRFYYKECEGPPPADADDDVSFLEAIPPHPDPKNTIRKHMLYKRSLTKEERANGGFCRLTFCNACGLRFTKQRDIRRTLTSKSILRSGGRQQRRDEKNEPHEQQPVPASDGVQEPAPQTMGDYPADVMKYMQQKPDYMWTASQDMETGPSMLGYQDIQRGPGGAEHEMQDVRPKRDDVQGEKSTSGLRTEDAPDPGAMDLQLGDNIFDKPTTRLLFPSSTPAIQAESSEDSRQGQSGFGLPTLGPYPCVSPSRNAVDAQDKENLPPSGLDDGLGHLFEDSSGQSFQSLLRTPKSAKHGVDSHDLLKTPTSGPKRSPLGPRRDFSTPSNASGNSFMQDFSPSKTYSASRLPMSLESPDIFKITSFDDSWLCDFSMNTPAQLPATQPDFSATFDFSLPENLLDLPMSNDISGAIHNETTTKITAECVSTPTATTDDGWEGLQAATPVDSPADVDLLPDGV